MLQGHQFLWPQSMLFRLHQHLYPAEEDIHFHAGANVQPTEMMLEEYHQAEHQAWTSNIMEDPVPSIHDVPLKHSHDWLTGLQVNVKECQGHVRPVLLWLFDFPLWQTAEFTIKKNS